MIIEKNGKKLIESPLVAKEDVEKASWWDLFKDHLECLQSQKNRTNVETVSTILAKVH